MLFCTSGGRELTSDVPVQQVHGSAWIIFWATFIVLAVFDVACLARSIAWPTRGTRNDLLIQIVDQIWSNYPLAFGLPAIVPGAWLMTRGSQVVGYVWTSMIPCRFGFCPLCFGFVWFLSFICRLSRCLETMVRFVKTPSTHCGNK